MGHRIGLRSASNWPHEIPVQYRMIQAAGTCDERPGSASQVQLLESGKQGSDHLRTMKMISCVVDHSALE